MKIIEAPTPSILPGTLLIQNHYSLISSGTEGSTVKTARKNIGAKAKERPQQVKQVIETLKTQGPVQTYRTVMKKLDAYSPLGYSCVGHVIDVSSDITDFKVGDLVACGGLSASHSEIVCVPKNLCVKLQTDADLRMCAYNSLGAIAVQGIRQTDLKLGETCTVIGLGLLGQLTALTLKSSGIRVIGIDVDQAMVDIAKKHCLDLAFNRSETGLEDIILTFTDGIGCDAVIITAASDSLDPINLAGALTRKKGTVVVVGAVPTGFDREPHFYNKELQLKMSCSYGPGRYDPDYEDKGIDYPPAYVRWTENRNMKVFQELVHSNKIDVSYLTTHTFDLDEAPKAYDMILNKSEHFIGILIKYDHAKEVKQEKIQLKTSPSPIAPRLPSVSIGFIGAGSYAQSHLLPHIKKHKNTFLKGVMTATSTSSRSVAERFGFEFCTGDEKDILENDDIDTVFVTTRHNTHANYVLKSLKAGKHVFVEKPLCLAEEELNQIKDIYIPNNEMSSSDTHTLLLFVGYNRRFSTLIQTIKAKVREGPMAMTYRINAGDIPKDSWIQDIKIGGGRIIGEVCHFIDCLTFINGSLPVSVYATVMNSPNNLNDVLNISLKYQNGSIGNISYFSNGDKSLSKERIEIFSSGCSFILDDFKVLSSYIEGRKKKKKLLVQDKGQKSEIKQFLEMLKNKNTAVIPFNEIYNTSLVTFGIIKSIQQSRPVEIQNL